MNIQTQSFLGSSNIKENTDFKSKNIRNTNFSNPSFAKLQNQDHGNLNSVVAGGIFTILGIIVAKKVKSVFSTPSKATAKLIQDKTEALDGMMENIESFFSKEKSEILEKLKSQFIKVQVDSSDASRLKSLSTEINSANTKEELIQKEELAFSQLNTWYLKNLGSGKKTTEGYKAIYDNYAKEYSDALEKAVNEALEKIETISTLPESALKEKRAKKAIGIFNSKVATVKESFNEAKINNKNEFENEGRILFRQINNYSSNVVRFKNLITSEIMSASKERAKDFSQGMNKLPKAASDTINTNMTIIPKSMPFDFFNDKFYKYSDLSDGDFKDKIPDFVAQLNEEYSIRDVQTLINRMELRRGLETSNIQSLNWYDAKIDQLNTRKSSVVNYIEDSLLNSGKQINTPYLSLEQKEQMLFALQEYSKKMGYPSTKEFVEYINLADVFQEIDANDIFAEQQKYYSTSFIRKIYPYIKDELTEMNEGTVII